MGLVVLRDLQMCSLTIDLIFHVSPRYSDLNQHTPERVPLVEDYEAVHQSITNILATPKGTRFFNPEFASNVEGLLFEPLDGQVAFLLSVEVLDQITRWDPRVEIVFGESKVTPNYDENVYAAEIYFEIQGLEGKFEYRAILSD